MYASSGAAGLLADRRESGAVPGPLRLTAIRHRTFPGGTDDLRAPDVRAWFDDMTRGRGLGHSPERVDAAAGTTFVSMAHAVARDLAGRPDGARQVDLAIVAHAAPEFDPRRSAPVALTAVLPGGPLSFCVGGRLATHTALRVAAAHATRHPVRRVLVLALEQGSMPYDVPQPVDDAATVLVLDAPDPGDPPGIGTVFRGDVGTDEAPAALADVVGDIAAARPGPPPLVVRGAGRDTATGDGPVGSPHLPCSGSWATLAALPLPASRPVVVADHDPSHRALAASVLRW